MAETTATGTGRRSRLAAAHGLFHVATGLWPLPHYRSFEAVTGPKTDHLRLAWATAPGRRRRTR